MDIWDSEILENRAKKHAPILPFDKGRCPKDRGLEFNKREIPERGWVRILENDRII